ncbi:MAG: efflux RND transporter permease subunit, partial [Candidatus Gracilibacteria bacterium]|nr:efflux RND transporter permease subunit [Candidatus Gracilibacteria bacterium]
GMTKEKIIGQMNKAIKIDKLWNGFTQPIIGRIDMLSTGIRSQVGVKIFGDDPVKLEELAIKTEELMGNVPGASGVAAIRTTGLRYLDIHLRDDLMAQYGIPKAEALMLISAGIGGEVVSTTIEGRERYGIEIRLKQEFRQDVEDIESLPIMGMSESQVLLGNIADVRLVDGPAVISSENGVILSAVQMNVEGRDLVSFVEEGKQHLEKNLELPSGYRVEWSGQYENQLRAKQRLSWIVPTVIFVIFVILFIVYKDLGLVSIVMLSIPLSLVGGLITLFFADFNFSVAVWVGFISLFGNAVETGVVIVVYLENAFRTRFGLPLVEGEIDSDSKYSKPQPITREGILEAVLEGATKRLRPILMTAFTSVLGMIPMLTTRGVGAEVQKPLAFVVVGGLTTSVILTLILLPVLFSYLRERMVEA